MNMMDFLHSEGNKYSIFPNEIANLSSQKISDTESLENAPLTPEIQVVRLNSNHLTRFPTSALKQCTNLRFLDISKNKIETLDGINEIENLVLIDISKNLLVELKGIEDNTNLRRVLASKNQIVNVSINREMPNLVLLDLHSNAVSALEFGKFCPKLSELYVDACQLKTIRSISDFPSLQHMTVSHNMICDDEEVSSATLSNLDISWNRITSIKPFMGMESLIYLNVEGNPLTDAGLSVASILPSLRCFKFGHTQISRLSQLSRVFPNIEIVDASHSLLSSMDDVVEFVKTTSRLKSLDTRFTPLTEGLYQEDEQSQERIWEGLKDYEAHNEGNTDERRQYRMKIVNDAQNSLETLDSIKVRDDIEITNSEADFGSQEDENSIDAEEEHVCEEEEVSDTKDKLIAELKEQNGELRTTIKQLQKELKESQESKSQVSESSDSSSKKKYMHDLIAKYQKENELMKQFLEAKMKEPDTEKLVKSIESESQPDYEKLMAALYKQNTLLLEEINGLKSIMELSRAKSDQYPHVMSLIDTLLGRTRDLRDRYATHTESSHPPEKPKSSKHHHHHHHHHHHKKHEEKKHKKSSKHKHEHRKRERKVKESPTYFIPGPPPAVPQYPVDQMQLEQPKRSYNDDNAFPYPIQPLRWLQFHPLPEDNTCLCLRRITAPATTSIKRFECKEEGDIEPYEYRNEYGLCHRQKEKVPAVSYPFNQTSPRKLPWDGHKYPSVEVKPNKAKREPLKLTCRYCETLILKNARVVTPENGLQGIESGSHHFEVVSFWVNSALGFGKEVSSIFKFGFSERFLEMEREKQNLLLVLYPCADPSVYVHVALPPTVVVHRFVTKFEAPKPTAFLLCAVDLGKQGIDKHTNLIPTETTTKKMQKDGFDSLWFCRNGVESILLRDSDRLVPLYGVVLKCPAKA